MRRSVAIGAALALAACNQLFGLDAPADDTADDDATIDAAPSDGSIDAPLGCGDDVVDPETEQCDDGNLVPWDGCNAQCHLEEDVGCADGIREDASGNGRIAACAGAWSKPGLAEPPSADAGCIDTGDDGPPVAGGSCSAANLCAAGWHICADAIEVAERLADPCGVGFEPGFYATNQPSDGAARCVAGIGVNDIFGCGDLGLPALDTTCTPLDRYSGDLCAGLGGSWTCPQQDTERATVIKTTAAGGGVLCCR
jgi:cysteine-rich repeat protein